MGASTPPIKICFQKEKKDGFLLLAIVTFPLHPLLGKMLKILMHGSDKRGPGPAFTVFLVVQPTMLSEHTCTPAEKVHSHAEAKPPSHMYANILFIVFTTMLQETLAYDFPFFNVIVRFWYQGNVSLIVRTGK